MGLRYQPLDLLVHPGQAFLQRLGRGRRVAAGVGAHARPVPEEGRYVWVKVKGVRLELLRDFGNAWLALGLWRLLDLDALLSRVMPASREDGHSWGGPPRLLRCRSRVASLVLRDFSDFSLTRYQEGGKIFVPTVRRPAMSREEVKRLVTETLAKILELGGHEVPVMSGATCPLADLPGFDSLTDLEFSIMISELIKLSKRRLCVGADGKDTLTIDQIVEYLATLKST